MEAPSILAIDDVNLYAHPRMADELVMFYSELLGLEHRSSHEQSQLTFSGYPVSGPWLVVNLAQEYPEDPFVGARLTILVKSLLDCAEQLDERRLPYQWSRGFEFYDCRLFLTDPAGYRVELVTRHPI
jgi:hypothetical protein